MLGGGPSDDFTAYEKLAILLFSGMPTFLAHFLSTGVQGLENRVFRRSASVALDFLGASTRNRWAMIVEHCFICFQLLIHICKEDYWRNIQDFIT